MDSHNFTHVLQVFQLKGLHHIHNVIIPTFNISVEYVFGQWTKWSNCSKECGPGDKTRTRNCIDKAYDDEAKIVSVILNFLNVFITFLFFSKKVVDNSKCSSRESLFVRTRSCEIKTCPRDGGWTDWEKQA